MNTQAETKELTLDEMVTEINNAIDKKDVKLISIPTRRNFKVVNYNADEIKTFTLDIFNQPLNNRAVTRRSVNVIDFLIKNTSNDTLRPHMQVVQLFGDRLVSIGERASMLYDIKTDEKHTETTFAITKNLLAEGSLQHNVDKLKANYNSLVKNFGKVVDSKEYNINELINRLKFAFELQKVISFELSNFSAIEFNGNLYNTKNFYTAIKFFNDMKLDTDKITLEVGNFNMGRLCFGEHFIYIGDESQMGRGTSMPMPTIFINKI